MTCLEVREGARAPLKEEVWHEPLGPRALASEQDEWLRRGDDLVRRLEGASLEWSKRSGLAGIAREDAKLARRVRAVRGDLDIGAAAEVDADFARLFIAKAAKAPRGSTHLSAVDWATGEPVTRELTLDPAKHPREQVEAMFARARRLVRGRTIAQARIAEAELKRERLASLREAMLNATKVDEITDARERARRLDPALVSALDHGRAEKTSSSVRHARARVPFRTFVTSAGVRILVGRGAADNDALTLHTARPHDLWLHVKGEAGAHVVVPLEKGRDVTAEVLVDAAHLATHFSNARDEAVVDVSYTTKRYVRKRRGSPPGQVQVDREKVVALRVDPRRLSVLLAREEATA